VNGTSGSGKSTLARRLGVLLDLPYTELDSLFHGPGWTANPAFDGAVAALAAGQEWVVEFQYDQARPVLAGRTDLMVWLDLPRHLVMRRVVRRTVRRRIRREELWNGNREAPLRTVWTDPEHIIRWAWDTHTHSGPRVDALLAERPEVVVVRLRTPREVERWLAGPVAAWA
jgi:adenylate kinase family enzyme